MVWFGRPEAAPKPVNWKWNLAALWASQFISLSAFSFCLPFLALYIRNRQIVPEGEVLQWASILNAVPSFSMMIFAPIWGIMGDRYGRKMMLVRANLAGGFVLYLMGVVDSIEGLIVLRILHGAFTGTVPAAQTLVATNTPDRNQGFAIGVIMAAVNAGTMAGNYFGGLCAEHFGPVFSFKLGGVLLFLSTALVVFAVRENFVKPVTLPSANTRSARLRRRRDSINSFKSGIPILLVIGYVSFLYVYDSPYLSLYVDEIFRHSPAASGMTDEAVTSRVFGVTGWVSAVASIAATLGSVVVGIVMDKKLPAVVWAATAAVCAVGAVWIGSDASLFGLTAGRVVYLFFLSGLGSSLVVLLGRMTPSSKRGAAMGWAMTTRSIGWVVGPLTGGYISAKLGWSSSYLFLAGFSAALIPMFLSLYWRYPQAFYPDEEATPESEAENE